MNNTISINKRQLLAAICMILVFFLDFILPMGLSVSLLYLVCFFLLFRESKKAILFFLFLTIALIVLDLAIVYRVDFGWKEYADIGMSVLAVVIGALMSMKYRGLLEKTNKERENYTKSLEEMLFMTSHKVRSPVATWLGLLNVIDFNNPSKEDMLMIYQHIKTSSAELNLFTEELTAFMHKKVMKNKAIPHEILSKNFISRTELSTAYTFHAVYESNSD